MSKEKVTDIEKEELKKTSKNKAEIIDDDGLVEIIEKKPKNRKKNR